MGREISDRVEKHIHRSMTHYHQEAEAAQRPLRDERARLVTQGWVDGQADPVPGIPPS